MVTVRKVEFRAPQKADRWTPTPAIVEEMVRRLAERFDPERIILFGSLARDEARRHSDVDLLLVFDHPPDVPEVMKEGILLLADLGVSADVLAVSEARLRALEGRIGSTLAEAEREGKVVFERERERPVRMA